MVIEEVDQLALLSVPIKLMPIKINEATATVTAIKRIVAITEETPQSNLLILIPSFMFVKI
jgi:hypothetical protein